MIIAPWCNRKECEEEVKTKTSNSCVVEDEGGEGIPALTGSAKTLCIPLEQEAIPEGTKCACCDQKATVNVLWGRSY